MSYDIPNRERRFGDENLFIRLALSMFAGAVLGAAAIEGIKAREERWLGALAAPFWELQTEAR